MPDNIDFTLSNLIVKEVSKLLDEKLKESNIKISNLEERITKLESKQNNEIIGCSPDKNNYTILEMPENRRAPITMIFPDDTRYDNIGSWSGALMKIISYLIGSGKFIFRNEFKHFINTNKYKSNGVKNKEISKYFLNMSGTGEYKLEWVNLLLKTHNLKIETIYDLDKPVRNKTYRPIKMILNHKVYKIVKWNNITQIAVKHLLHMGIFKFQDKFAKYINEGSFDTGKYYNREVLTDKYYINLHGSAEQFREQTSEILKEHGFDPSLVKLVYIIDGIEEERELNDVPGR